ncbi:SRPBCC family protein [Brasilonema bromeliae]|uniref:Cyclase/dehydrase n=1 Tax=Brasilonema bromeliae SPC951 TaxID=385972 RepID=A0ABX1PDH5_9CYAN|nr:SRPBCC family protein [Brasilonema bromeliae]NMG22416.1 cyclase/dehydrase [Brasilonema bromeliae SPC951]
MSQFLRSCLFAGYFSVIATIAVTPSVYAELFNSPVDKLPVAERVKLRNGQALVTGEKGKYTAKVLVTASPDIAWEVLTDYDNFSKFLPNTVSGKVLEVNGNQKVVEQVDTRQVFLMNVQSRIRSAITETAKNRIDFRQIDGDLQSLDGYWKIEPVAPYSGAKANQVLITQVVEAQPKSGTPKKIFYNLFKDSLGDILTAVKREVDRRNR